MAVGTFRMLGLAMLLASIGLSACSSAQPPVPQQAAPKVQPTVPPQPAPQAQTVAVTDVKVTEPRSDNEPYRVEGTIRPENPGGPADVTFRLRNRASGEVVQTAGQVQLTPGVALVVVSEIRAPRADYIPEVEVRLQPR